MNEAVHHMMQLFHEAASCGDDLENPKPLFTTASESCSTRGKIAADQCCYSGLNNYLYYFGGFLVISIVYENPKPYSNY